MRREMHTKLQSWNFKRKGHLRDLDLMEYNTEVHVLQIGWEHEGWFHMDQRRIQRGAVVTSIMKY
jgi:hypothetical protein